MNYKVFRNSLYLIAGQSATYLTPLLITPYVIYFYGLDGFGVIAFSYSIVSILRVVINWGFDVTGTKNIAANSTLVERTICDVYSAKFFLFVIVLAFCFFIIPFLQFSDSFNLYVYFACIIMMVSDLLIPVWYYLGTERAKEYGYIRIAQKTLNLVLFFLLIDASMPLYSVPLIESLAACVVAIFSLVKLNGQFKIRVNMNYGSIKDTLADGYNVFISSVSVLFYTTINSVILGSVAEPNSVGIYSLAEKVYSAVRGIFNPVVQASYPTFVRCRDNIDIFQSVAKRYVLLFTFSLSIVTIVLIFFSDFVIGFLSSSIPNGSKFIFYIMISSLIFAIGSLTSMILVILERSDILKKITFFSAVLNCILILPACYYFDSMGAAVVFFVVQMAQFFLQFYYYRKICHTLKIQGA